MCFLSRRNVPGRAEGAEGCEALPSTMLDGQTGSVAESDRRLQVRPLEQFANLLSNLKAANQTEALSCYLHFFFYFKGVV